MGMGLRRGRYGGAVVTAAERAAIRDALAAADAAVLADDPGAARHYAREASERAGDAWRAERDAAAEAAQERRRARRREREDTE